MEEVFPRVVFHFFGVPVRDTVISTWVMMVAVVLGSIWITRALPTAAELLLEYLNETFSDVLGRPAWSFIPLLGSLLIFIALADNLSVIPLLTAPTKDINTPLALAIVVFVLVHYYGLREKGVGRYLKQQLSPMIVLDLIGQLSRTMSLTLRLFGNIVSGEMIVAVIFSLTPVIAPLPMMGLSLFTGVLQAYIFTMLASSYIASALEE